MLAAVIGDNIGFVVGHFGGRPLAERFGRYVFLTPQRLDRAEAFFDRHGGKVVTIARFIDGLRQVNGLLAGIAGMHWLNFLGYNALGAALLGGHLERAGIPRRASTSSRSTTRSSGTSGT